MVGFLDNLLARFRNERTSPTETKGAPGTAIYGGYIQEAEKNAKLIGREKYRTYSEILTNTAIVAAGTRYFLNLVAKATWRVIPANDSAQARAFADHLELMMGDMTTPWHRVVRRAAMYRFYGFSVQEWTAKRNEDGTISMMDIEPRPQITVERWDVDRTGTVQGILQRSPQTQEEIYLPRSKLVYLVDDTLNDSPEGLGLFRHVVEPAKRLQRFEQLEAFGFEADLRGVPIGRVPFAELQAAVDRGEITAEQKATIEKPMMDFIRNHIKSPSLGLLLDSITYQSDDEASTPSSVQQWGIDLLTSSANSQKEVADAIERLNQEIARILGVEGLLLGSTNHGSQALSTDKSHNFALIIDSTLAELTETFQKDFINPIWDLNGWPEELKPSFKTEATQYRDVTQITAALKDMATAGAVLSIDDPVINEVRDLLGLSDQVLPSDTDIDSTLIPSPKSDEGMPATEDKGLENE